MTLQLGQELSLQDRPYRGERDLVAVAHPKAPQVTEGDQVTFAGRPIGRITALTTGTSGLVRCIIHLRKAPEQLGLA